MMIIDFYIIWEGFYEDLLKVVIYDYRKIFGKEGFVYIFILDVYF